jgi:uncharacterized protein involved in response to NO
MTRATLGHTGRLLSANRATQFIFGSIVVAALLRIGAALDTAQGNVLLHLSALAWILAYVVFAAIYGPMLLQRKVV